MFPLPRLAATGTLAGVLLCAPAAAQVYSGIDASGTLVLSNHPTEVARELIVPADLAAAPPASPTLPARSDTAVVGAVVAPPQLEGSIQEAARRHTLSPALLRAVISTESHFDPRAVSRKGAKGLMQLMPATARRFGVKDVFSVAENLDAGAAYLRELLTRFEGDLVLALAAYNAGEGAVLRAGRRVPAFPETQQYVAKVLARAGEAPQRVLP